MVSGLSRHARCFIEDSGLRTIRLRQIPRTRPPLSNLEAKCNRKEAICFSRSRKRHRAVERCCSRRKHDSYATRSHSIERRNPTAAGGSGKRRGPSSLRHLDRRWSRKNEKIPRFFQKSRGKQQGGADVGWLSVSSLECGFLADRTS
jgi:hypothetical protein